jgi:hypothetical protein
MKLNYKIRRRKAYKYVEIIGGEDEFFNNLKEIIQKIYPEKQVMEVNYFNGNNVSEGLHNITIGYSFYEYKSMKKRKYYGCFYSKPSYGCFYSEHITMELIEIYLNKWKLEEELKINPVIKKKVNKI